MQLLAHLALAGLLSLSSLPIDPAAATFHDDVLHYTLTYPSTLVPANVASEIMDKAKAETNNADMQKAIGCITTPLVAVRQTDDFAMMMVIRMNLECLGAPATTSVLQPMAQSSLQQGLMRLGLATVGTPTPYKLDGHDAVYIRGTVTDTGGKDKAFGAASCTLVDKTAVCFEAIATDKATVSSLSATSMNFDQHAPQPLVPADVIAK
jgi:hypothetical protein